MNPLLHDAPPPLADDNTDAMIERTPGQGPYRRVEREFRWVLRGLPDALGDPVEIVDTYVAHSTLRLREVRTTSAVVYKLGQKVRQTPRARHRCT